MSSVLGHDPAKENIVKDVGVKVEKGTVVRVEPEVPPKKPKAEAGIVHDDEFYRKLGINPPPRAPPNVAIPSAQTIITNVIQPGQTAAEPTGSSTDRAPAPPIASRVPTPPAPQIQPAPLQRLSEKRARSLSAPNRPKRSKNTPSWMRAPPDPEVMRQRRADYEGELRDNNRKAVQLFPVVETWSDVLIETNRINRLSSVVAETGGHIASIPELERCKARDAIPQSPKLVSRLLSLLRTKTTPATGALYELDIDPKGWISCSDVIKALKQELPILRDFKIHHLVSTVLADEYWRMQMFVSGTEQATKAKHDHSH